MSDLQSAASRNGVNMKKVIQFCLLATVGILMLSSCDSNEEVPIFDSKESSDITANSSDNIAKSEVPKELDTPFVVTKDKGENYDKVDSMDEVTFANTQWRILKLDIDKSREGNQALIIKVDALTQLEATGQGITSGYYEAIFNGRETYFDSNGSNGYEVGNTDNYLKACIDRYYGTISDADKDYILPVDLHNPDYTTYITSTDGGSFSGSVNDSGWSWFDSYTDTRFATTITTGDENKQAFALSYGDINATLKLSGKSSSTLLNFDSPDDFWLRSASGNVLSDNGAGYVSKTLYYVQSDVANFVESGVTDTSSIPIRPALVLSLGS